MLSAPPGAGEEEAVGSERSAPTSLERVLVGPGPPRASKKLSDRSDFYLAGDTEKSEGGRRRSLSLSAKLGQSSCREHCDSISGREFPSSAHRQEPGS